MHYLTLKGSALKVEVEVGFQYDQIGRLSKLLGHKFSFKVAQKSPYIILTALGTF